MATAQAVKPATATAAVTVNQSLAATKHMFRATVSQVLFMRKIFRPDAFVQKAIAGNGLCILRPFDKSVDREDVPPSACKLAQVIEDGVFEALGKRYLRQMLLEIYDGPGEEARMVECYAWEVDYRDSGEVGLNMRHGSDSSQYELASIRDAASSILIQLVEMCEVLQPLPPGCSVRVVLKYTDETPRDYQPPAFKDHTGKSMPRFPARPCKDKVGDLDMLHNRFKLRVATLFAEDTAPTALVDEKQDAGRESPTRTGAMGAEVANGREEHADGLAADVAAGQASPPVRRQSRRFQDALRVVVSCTYRRVSMRSMQREFPNMDKEQVQYLLSELVEQGVLVDHLNRKGHRTGTFNLSEDANAVKASGIRPGVPIPWPPVREQRSEDAARKRASPHHEKGDNILTEQQARLIVGVYKRKLKSLGVAEAMAILGVRRDEAVSCVSDLERMGILKARGHRPRAVVSPEESREVKAVLQQASSMVSAEASDEEDNHEEHHESERKRSRKQRSPSNPTVRSLLPNPRG